MICGSNKIKLDQVNILIRYKLIWNPNKYNKDKSFLFLCEAFTNSSSSISILFKNTVRVVSVPNLVQVFFSESNLFQARFIYTRTILPIMVVDGYWLYQMICKCLQKGF